MECIRSYTSYQCKRNAGNIHFNLISEIPILRYIAIIPQQCLCLIKWVQAEAEHVIRWQKWFGNFAEPIAFGSPVLISLKWKMWKLTGNLANLIGMLNGCRTPHCSGRHVPSVGFHPI